MDEITEKAAEIRDATLLEIAGWLEEPDLGDIQGLGAKRKRDREDATLRAKTSKEVRANLAQMVRGRMTNKVGDPLEFLRDVATGRHDKHYTGYDLREAIALADKGLLEVHAFTKIAGPWNNVLGGETKYSITLTDAGRTILLSSENGRG